MKVLIFFIGIAAFVFAILVFFVSTRTRSAIHEIEALLLLLVAVIAIAAASIMQRMDDAAASRERAARSWLGTTSTDRRTS